MFEAAGGPVSRQLRSVPCVFCCGMLQGLKRCQMTAVPGMLIALWKICLCCNVQCCPASGLQMRSGSRCQRMGVYLLCSALQFEYMYIRYSHGITEG